MVYDFKSWLYDSFCSLEKFSLNDEIIFKPFGYMLDFCDHYETCN